MIDYESLMKDLPQGTVINVPLFTGYMIPNGFLGTAREEHALFFYYVNARRVYEERVLDKPIVMEGDDDPLHNFEQLFLSVAAMYNVKPEAMARAWGTIDKQAASLGLPLLPKDYQYRFIYNDSELLQ